MEQRQEGLGKFSSQRQNICKHSHNGKPGARAWMGPNLVPTFTVYSWILDQTDLGVKSKSLVSWWIMVWIGRSQFSSIPISSFGLFGSVFHNLPQHASTTTISLNLAISPSCHFSLGESTWVLSEMRLHRGQHLWLCVTMWHCPLFDNKQQICTALVAATQCKNCILTM